MYWNDVLREETNKEYYVNELAPFLRKEYSENVCYPPKEDIFNAFKYVNTVENTKVVILGQDPYHEPGEAHGLSFSVKNGKMPPSLKNIISEIEREYSYPYNGDGNLTYLAEQGILLLNATLTVRQGQANSHSNSGWSTFTDNIIKLLGESDRPIVFMLWGKYAQRKAYLVTNPNALILKTSHPSPYSYNLGFNGCDHFLSCNKYLLDHGCQPINWYPGKE